MKQSKWIKAIGEDAILVALFVAWRVYGIQGAGNVLLLFMSVVAVVGTVFFILVLSDNEGKADYKRYYKRLKGTPAYTTYQSVSQLVHVAAFAWIGYYLLAVGLMLTTLAIVVARDRANKGPEPEVAQ